MNTIDYFKIIFDNQDIKFVIKKINLEYQLIITEENVILIKDDKTLTKIYIDDEIENLHFSQIRDIVLDKIGLEIEKIITGEIKHKKFKKNILLNFQHYLNCPNCI